MSGEIGRTFHLDDGEGGVVTQELVGVPEMAWQPGDPQRGTDGERLIAAVRARAAQEIVAAQTAGPTAIQNY